MGKALILTFLIITRVSGAVDWRGLAPLSSTRADVERLLGRPAQGSGNVYQTGGEKVSVTYSERPCDYGWQVPLGTVVSFFVYPKNPTPFANLKLDERKYERRKDPHIASRYYYVNQEEGINYTVDADAGVVMSIEYYPSAKDMTRQCSSSPTLKPEESKSIKAPRKRPRRGHKP